MLGVHYLVSINLLH